MWEEHFDSLLPLVKDYVVSIWEARLALGAPVMSKNTFITTELCIGEWWREQLPEAMKKRKEVNFMKVSHDNCDF